MIKTELTIINNCIKIGKLTILCDTRGEFMAHIGVDSYKMFHNLEQAIAYCMEQSK